MNQGMRTFSRTGVAYREGSVSTTGTRHKQTVNDRGYMELTEYLKLFDTPM
jgi:predicted secreted hydrolase